MTSISRCAGRSAGVSVRCPCQALKAAHRYSVPSAVFRLTCRAAWPANAVSRAWTMPNSAHSASIRASAGGVRPMYWRCPRRYSAAAQTITVSASTATGCAVPMPRARRTAYATANSPVLAAPCSSGRYS